MIWIVSVTYNDEAHLHRTLESVRRYKKPYQRYAVIDGKSTDGTMELVREYSDLIDYVISEPDSGIYDAMNKVVNIPDIEDNDFIIWINAGDELVEWPDAILHQMTGYDCAFCGVFMADEASCRTQLFQPQINLPYNEQNFWPRSSYNHQGFFIRRQCFSKIKYDLQVGIQAESLLMSTAIITLKFMVSSTPVAKYYIGGMSVYPRPVLVSWLKTMWKLKMSIPKVLWRNKKYTLVSVVLASLPRNIAYKLLMWRFRATIGF